MKDVVLEFYKGFPIRKQMFDGEIEYYSYKGMFAISRRTIKELKKDIDEGYLD